MTDIPQGLCQCGCGEPTTPGKRYIKYHTFRTNMSDEERFWSKVDKAGPLPESDPALGPCWLWTGAGDGYGYGSFNFRGRSYRAHRVSYEWAHDSITPDLTIDHLCRVTLCVRPDHLDLVTRRENRTRQAIDTGCVFDGDVIVVCHRGHRLTPENTYTPPGRTERVCRKCKRMRERRRASEVGWRRERIRG